MNQSYFKQNQTNNASSTPQQTNITTPEQKTDNYNAFTGQYTYEVKKTKVTKVKYVRKQG